MSVAKGVVVVAIELLVDEGVLVVAVVFVLLVDGRFVAELDDIAVIVAVDEFEFVEGIIVVAFVVAVAIFDIVVFEVVLEFASF
jgi:hypothetical protein